MLKQPDQRREIIFKGQLQQKITKRTGTLLRKKRAIYEDELWVLLCVHDSGNGGIPHLEWYADLRSAYQHNPLCVQDLLDCQYVNVAIGEERCIVIGFVDKNRPVLELSAPSVEERRQWVVKLTETLRRLNCLKDDGFEDGITACSPRAENEYVALNAVEESHSKARAEQPHQSMPTNNEMGPYVPVIPILQQMSAAAQKLSLTDTIPMHSSPPSTSASPPFPSPRAALQASASMPNNPTILPRQQASKPINISPFKQTSSIAKHSQISPNSTIAEDEELDQNLPPPLPPRKAGPSPTPDDRKAAIPALPSSPIPNSPPPIHNAGEYDALERCNNQKNSFSQYDQLAPAGHQYQQLSHLSGEFPEQQTLGLCALRFSSSSTATNSTSNSSEGQQQIQRISMPSSSTSPRNSAQYDILHSLPPPPPIPNYVDHTFLESMARPRKVSLSLSLLAEHVAFVDAGGSGKVWVAGWSPRVDTNLRNILHFGDEVETMAGCPLKSIQQLPQIYANTKPGVQIELMLRANHSAKVYTLTRPNNPKRELGIVLHKKKNKIASIEQNSPAGVAQLPARLPPYLFNPKTSEVPAVITEVDGIPLSLYARNEQFFHRLEQIPIDSPVNITLHPNDFCVLLARQLKTQVKEYLSFVHDS